MRFEKIIPAAQLRPFIRWFVLSENDEASSYHVLPSTGMVMGFQYKGTIAFAGDDKMKPLSTAGITGMTDRVKTFANSKGVGSVLVYFTETGLAQFCSSPAHELFNQSISLDHVFDAASVRMVEDKLRASRNDAQRIAIVEKFLLSHLNDIRADKLIVEAVRMIYQSKGAIRMKELHTRLLISQSPFEKRFRKIVGATPKKFASVVRFNAVLDELSTGKTLTEICYENNFFDPAHFSKDFKQFTGQTPEDFRLKQ